MTRRMTGHRAALLAASLLIFCTGAATYWFYHHTRADEATSVELTHAFLNIERSIGYAGFIHHFKNHVLRPNDPHYAELAHSSYQLATKEIAKLQSIINLADIQVDVSDLQNTLNRYRDSIDEISKAHLSGVSVTEIDRQFKIPDEAAATILLDLQTQIERLLQERRQATVKLGWLSLLFFLAVVGSLIAHLAFTWFEQQRNRQREYLLQQQEMEMGNQHAREMAKLVMELERSNRELDGFAYTASHDLKEPMRGIAINANFLARENVSEKGRKRIERMIALTTRMDLLISDILYFSRLGRGDKEKEDVDLTQIIEGIQVELREWLKERGGKIKIAGDLPLIHANRSKVKTVLQNLIVNGLKYNDAEHKIVEIGYQAEVKAGGANLRNVFHVRDNGIGIAESNSEKIYRIFSRLNREEDYGQGTGAGLSFVRKIVEDYGCEITFTSQLGEGTTFHFSLPLADITNEHPGTNKCHE